MSLTKHTFFEELFLYSGQYALFYIIMTFVVSPTGITANTGHVALLFLILLQTYILSRYAKTKAIRFAGNFIIPLGYSLIESFEGIQFLLNAAHIGFWIFALITALIQLLLYSRHQKTADAALTISNIFSFIYVYLYLDIKLSLGTPTPEQLEIYNFPAHIPTFFVDIAHVYMFLASILLIIIIAFGRQKIINLQEYIRTAFGKYVDPSVRDKILQQHKPTKETKTLLFSDLRSFTTYSEVHTPEQVTKMLNETFTLWSKVADKHKGIIDKYIGDAVLIVFEKPQDAVNCALDFDSIYKTKRDKLPLKYGVGIHCGEVIVGDIGSETRKNYTVIGDTVNIAARLESVCKDYKKTLIFSDAVKSQISNKTKSLGYANLKGKSKPLPLFTILR